MANVRELKHRIKAVQKTKQITRAMKMVATVRYKRALESFQSAKPYLAGIAKLKSRIFSLPGIYQHPLFETRKVERLGVIVIGSDKGLCGSFNSNLFRLALRSVSQEIESGKNVKLILLGRKSKDFFKRLPYPIAESEMHLEATPFKAKELTKKWAAYFTSGHYDQVVVMHNHFINVMQCVPMATQLFPLVKEPGELEEPFAVLLEPDKPSLIAHMAVHAPEMAIYQILLESSVAEQGIRMTMMDQATQKADDLTRELTVHMNKARQASITNELIEMTAASEALR